MKFLLVILIFSLTGTCQNEAIKEESETTGYELKKENEIKRLSDYIKENNLDSYRSVTLAGGCFWCVEGAFERINGVVDVISGYSGGKKDFPTYYEVGSGKLEHAEAVEVFFDESVIDYNKILEVFYVAHDGTQLNRQGPDVGPQYRSAIFYKTEEEKEQAEAYISKIEKEQNIDVVTQIAPYTEFWVAEEYHQNFYELNPNQGYVRSVSKPKVEKVVKKFKDILKEEYR